MDVTYPVSRSLPGLHAAPTATTQRLIVQVGFDSEDPSPEAATVESLLTGAASSSRGLSFVF
jgi:hypothetical protein